MGLVSTSATATLSMKFGEIRQARSASASKVPRPGPNSATVIGRELAHRLPHGDRPKAEQLAKDLADLRRCDEIARAADRLTRGVDPGPGIEQTGFHVGFDAERAVRGDAGRKPRRERGALRFGLAQRAHQAIAGFCRARQISHSPISTMGIE